MPTLIASNQHSMNNGFVGTETVQWALFSSFAEIFRDCNRLFERKIVTENDGRWERQTQWLNNATSSSRKYVSCTLVYRTLFRFYRVLSMRTSNTYLECFLKEVLFFARWKMTVSADGSVDSNVLRGKLLTF